MALGGVACNAVFDLSPGEFFRPTGNQGGAGGASTSSATGGKGGQTSAQGGGPECTQDESCDDSNPCTIDQCAKENTCLNTPLDDIPAPDASQEVGDCKTKRCSGGKVIEIVDDTDIAEDTNQCVKRGCNQGTQTLTYLPLGNECADKMNADVKLCDGNGTCVACTLATDCPGEDTECQQRLCDNNTCVQVFSALDKVLSLQTGGDCKLAICDGFGMETTKVDNSDVPIDGKECTTDECENGNPINTNNNGAKCSAGTCNGMGQCEGCGIPDDCGSPNDCLKFKCENKVCVEDYTADGTPVSPQHQIANDCKEIQCNGSGNKKTVADDNDLPTPTANDCEYSSCSNGNPSQSPESLNTSCMTAMYCDGNKVCVQCNDAGQCSAAADCQTDICSLKACSFMNDALNSPAPASYQEPDDCKLHVCDGMGMVSNTQLPFDMETPPTDMNDCTDDLCQNGKPSYDDKLDGTLCGAVGMCVMGMCEGGTSSGGGFGGAGGYGNTGGFGGFGGSGGELNPISSSSGTASSSSAGGK